MTNDKVIKFEYRGHKVFFTLRELNSYMCLETDDPDIVVFNLDDSEQGEAAYDMLCIKLHTPRLQGEKYRNVINELGMMSHTDFMKLFTEGA